jgi:hypothetical protein
MHIEVTAVMFRNPLSRVRCVARRIQPESRYSFLFCITLATYWNWTDNTCQSLLVHCVGHCPLSDVYLVQYMTFRELAVLTYSCDRSSFRKIPGLMPTVVTKKSVSIMTTYNLKTGVEPTPKRLCIFTYLFIYL